MAPDCLRHYLLCPVIARGSRWAHVREAATQCPLDIILERIAPANVAGEPFASQLVDTRVAMREMRQETQDDEEQEEVEVEVEVQVEEEEEEEVEQDQEQEG